MTYFFNSDASDKEAIDILRKRPHETIESDENITNKSKFTNYLYIIH